MEQGSASGFGDSRASPAEIDTEQTPLSAVHEPASGQKQTKTSAAHKQFSSFAPILNGVDFTIYEFSELS